MVESILAGFVVSFGTIAFLMVQPPLGSLLYSFTILSLIVYKLDLFVGKPGLLTTRRLDIIELFLILLGNLVGTCAIGAAFFLIPNYGVPYMQVAADYVERHMTYGIDGLFVLSIFSGMVMYASITGWEKTHNWVLVCLGIMLVTLCDWPFIVQEFFIYIGVRWHWDKWYYLIPILLGNLIGSHIFPWLRKNSPRYKKENVTEDEPDIVDKLRDSFRKPVIPDENTDNPVDK